MDLLKALPARRPRAHRARSPRRTARVPGPGAADRRAQPDLHRAAERRRRGRRNRRRGAGGSAAGRSDRDRGTGGNRAERVRADPDRHHGRTARPRETAQAAGADASPGRPSRGPQGRRQETGGAKIDAREENAATPIPIPKRRSRHDPSPRAVRAAPDLRRVQFRSAARARAIAAAARAVGHLRAENGRRSAHQPRRRVDRLHGIDARQEGRHRRHRHLHGRLVRRRAAEADQQQEARNLAALEPRRPLPRLPLGPRRQENAGLSARPPRRRRAADHGLQNRRLGDRVVARQHEARAARSRSRSRRSEPGRGREGQEAQAARDHAAAVHARRRRLPERRQAPYPRLRHRGEEGSPDHLREVRRWRAGVVARWQADRIQCKSHRQPGRQRELRHLRRRATRRRGAASGDHVAVERQLAGIQPRRRVDRVCDRRRSEGHLVRHHQRRRGSRRRRYAAHPHRRPRPQRVASAVHARWRERRVHG